MKRSLLLLSALAFVFCNDHVQGVQRGGGAGGRGGGGGGAFHAGGGRPNFPQAGGNFSPQAGGNFPQAGGNFAQQPGGNYAAQMARPQTSMPVPRPQVGTSQYQRPLDTNLGNRTANFPS